MEKTGQTATKQMTLGSLFDGIGGWQLAAIRNGVKPVWSAEIERFPLEVTNDCKNCIFYHTYTIDDENYVYDECVLDGVRTLEHIYQREVLPVIEKNIEKLNEVRED